MGMSRRVSVVSSALAFWKLGVMAVARDLLNLSNTTDNGFKCEIPKIIHLTHGLSSISRPGLEQSRQKWMDF
jgi:hypothetical protein